MLSFPKSVLVGLSVSQGACAWGRLGHATVAYIAQDYLTPDAAAWSKGILHDSSDSYLANIASWADEYRATAAGRWSAPLHFIDAEDSPPSSCSVDYGRDCGNDGCSVSAVANYTRRVSAARLGGGERAQALKFLVHLAGDLTQPLHDEAYQRGGNGVAVTFDGHQDNLHADWDTYMPQQRAGGGQLADARGWADDLVGQVASGRYRDLAAGWIQGDDVADAVGTATRWAADANALVCSVVMPDGAEALQQGDLYPAYYDAVVDTIELQIAKGGYRLANWLNMISRAARHGRGEAAGAAAADEPSDLMGRDFLPDPRPMSRAQLARAAMDGSCCGKGRDGHEH
ncbi:uncharacterized protein UV8b_01409 [Ustilaginoidea virens]|uniref:Nuclease PA3 n=1 Tax=Ustilaginoidea virens TaxID=1159556 RepID=A0A8E5HKW0_USTVR|nr:uncharacterized protein UV8b_01409 [Ustilaginoidea virens]QUC17168.1 hypothetical protein UV8b_01409 [Ustilaginoidea virens]